jgi:hypothetical protein
MNAFVGCGAGRGGAEGGRGVDRVNQDSLFLSFVPNKKFFRYFREIPKNSYYVHRVCLSVFPQGTTPFPLKVFFVKFDI